jgi:hypothetical protein
MSRISLARALTATMLLVLPAMAPGTVVGPAYAAPGDPDDPAGTSEVTLGWPALGLEQGMFLGPNSSTSFTVPVPAGLNATRLRGTMDVPMNIGAGFLEIEDSTGRLLAAVGLPDPASPAPETPFDVDISSARVRASTIDVSFTVRPFADAGQSPGQYAGQYCGPLRQLAVNDLATVFTGTEAPPTTIAGFFPPVLERATIYAPTDADPAEQQSVLTLVSTLARLYNPQPLAITVVDQPRGATPPPAAPRARAIVVETGGAAGLRVEDAGNPGAHLRVSGSGDELSTQVSLLVNQLQTLAQTPASRVDQAGSDVAPTGDTLTFGQLNMTGRTDVLRTGNLAVGVGRAALGPGRVDSVQVHLLADYTPVPGEDAAAVVIRSGENVVYRAPLDNTGRLDATFDLDGQAFGQFINLELALTYTPQQMCGPLIAPITFQIDPASTLNVRRGGPPLSGFGALPSEFSPSFVVALDGSGPDQLVHAARIVAAIARIASTPLTPQVVGLDEAADASSGALIVADSEAISKTSLDPPIGGEGTTVDVGLPTQLRADIDDGLGSIQVFADRPRDRAVVLVTTTGAWTLVDPLFSYIDGANGNWSQLSGDVLAAGAAGTPTNLSIRADGDTAGSSAMSEPQADSPSRWILIGAAAAVVAAIAIVGLIVWSRRRRAT